MIWRYVAAIAAIAAVTALWIGTSVPIRFPNAGPVPSATAAMDTARFAQRITYSGHWEIVRRGGRLPGRVSARSFHPGDALTLLYWGERVRMYGIAGPHGGTGVVVVPGFRPAAVNFGASSRIADRLLFTSPTLSPGVHSLSVVVTRGQRRGYVNIVAFEVDGNPG